jgi:hypothetical protein
VLPIELRAEAQQPVTLGLALLDAADKIEAISAGRTRRRRARRLLGVRLAGVGEPVAVGSAHR